MSTAREDILRRVGAALAPLTNRAPRPLLEAHIDQLRRAGAEGPDRTALFFERLKAVNGVPLASPADLKQLLEAQACTFGFCDERLMARLQPLLSPGITLSSTLDPARLDTYQFGITLADGAIAETGTVVLGDHTTAHRLAALAPWIHIAVVRADTIQPDIPAGIAALPRDPNVVWVTGPSKTADVEGILIEGVHGPGIQAVWVD